MPRYRGTRSGGKACPTFPRLPARKLPAGVALREESEVGVSLAAEALFGRAVQCRDPLATRDACASLFTRCRMLQSAYLDEAGIALLFDVQAATLDSEICDTVAALVTTRVKGLARRGAGYGGTITVTLSRRGALWALAIADKDVCGALLPRLREPELLEFKSLVDHLRGAYVIQPVSDGTLLAVLFTDPPSVLHEALTEPGGPRFWN